MPNKQYSGEALKQAIEAIQNDSMSQHRAAATFGVPQKTLSRYITGESKPGVNAGRRFALPQKVEERIVAEAVCAADHGIGVSRYQFLARAGDIAKDIGGVGFQNATPSSGWWHGFKKRHPTIALRKPEATAGVRIKALEPVTTGEYFTATIKLMVTLNIHFKPHCIWHCDETCLQLVHQPTLVVARKGTKHLPGRVANSRESFTVLTTVNAAGLCHINTT